MDNPKVPVTCYYCHLMNRYRVDSMFPIPNMERDGAKYWISRQNLSHFVECVGCDNTTRAELNYIKRVQVKLKEFNGIPGRVCNEDSKKWTNQIYICHCYFNSGVPYIRSYTIDDVKMDGLSNFYIREEKQIIMVTDQLTEEDKKILGKPEPVDLPEEHKKSLRSCFIL